MLLQGCMKQPKLAQRMDSQTIGQHLADESVGLDVDQASLNAAIKDMTERARRRVVFNFSGGLPGPPTYSPTAARRLFNWLTRRRAGHLDRSEK